MAVTIAGGHKVSRKQNLLHSFPGAVLVIRMKYDVPLKQLKWIILITTLVWGFSKEITTVFLIDFGMHSEAYEQISFKLVIVA